jgi:hypothetical protein
MKRYILSHLRFHFLLFIWNYFRSIFVYMKRPTWKLILSIGGIHWTFLLNTAAYDSHRMEWVYFANFMSVDNLKLSCSSLLRMRLFNHGHSLIVGFVLLYGSYYRLFYLTLHMSTGSDAVTAHARYRLGTPSSRLLDFLLSTGIVSFLL